MTSIKTPTVFDTALLLRQATPFQRFMKGKHDAFSDLVLEQSLATQGEHFKIPQKEEKNSTNDPNVTKLAHPSIIQPHNIDQAATELVSLCFGTLLNSLFSSLKIEGGPGGEIWRSMLVEQYSKFIATSPMGEDLRNAIQAKILELQEDISDESLRICSTNANDRLNSAIS
ncbi:MAG: hypothetical protein LBH38_03705 [Holosporales bacterium]|jgi:hypothetical protein|nr:hypothetical protein [Holosporales bacterium]